MQLNVYTNVFLESEVSNNPLQMNPSPFTHICIALPPPGNTIHIAYEMMSQGVHPLTRRLSDVTDCIHFLGIEQVMRNASDLCLRFVPSLSHPPKANSSIPWVRQVVAEIG